jgi:transposase InsO family protein
LDIWFRPLFAFFIVDIHSRRVVHVGMTRAPTAEWTAQQLQEATPFGVGPDILVRDRDDKYTAVFDRVAKGAGIRIVRAAVRAPLMNAVVDRFLGSVRRECLDHIILLGEHHLEHVLREYAYRYFNSARPHQGLGQRVPVPGARAPYDGHRQIIGTPVLGGLHHDYCVAA